MPIENKDTSVIPIGDYCYTWIEYPSKENGFRGKQEVCHYYEWRTINGIEIPWCNYLNLGGTPACGNWKGWENYENAMNILNNHFGGEKEANKQLCLGLLFDYCKECGVNCHDDVLKED